MKTVYFRWFDFKDQILSHNLFLTKGLMGAPSLVDHPGVGNTFYMTATGENKIREQIFEEIRAKEFSSLPSRRSAIWLFDNFSLAQKCGEKWNFVKQGRDLLEVEIVFCRQMIKVDSKWVTCVATEYINNARKYWSGEMSDDPEPEILFDGALQLLGDHWQSKCKLLAPDALK